MVSRVCLGTMAFGMKDWGCNQDVATKMVGKFVEGGGNFIDTADIYSTGVSEEMVGKAIEGHNRDALVIATKVWFRMNPAPTARGLSRKHIMEAADASLRRLGTDYIDLYQFHVPDPATPVEETLRALDDLVRSGRVRYIGCSNFSGWQLSDGLWTSRMNSLHSFVTVTTRYNVLERKIEDELVPCCTSHDIGIIPWGPLAAGFLTGKYRRGEKGPAGARLSEKLPSPVYDNVMTPENWDKLEKLEGFAGERGRKVGELAIAWLLAKPWTSTVIAGARKVEQVKANVAAAEWRLSREEVEAIDRISGSPGGLPDEGPGGHFNA